MGSSYFTTRRAVSETAGLLLFGAMLIGAGVTASAPGGQVEASMRSLPQAASASPSRSAPRTVLILRVRHCEGCRVRVSQWVDVSRAPSLSREKAVRHDTVRFTVPSALTSGMEVAITAPWQGAIQYQTFAVLRYGTRVTGVLAWAPRQLATWDPMRGVSHGVYGSEQATLCSRPPS